MFRPRIGQVLFNINQTAYILRSFWAHQIKNICVSSLYARVSFHDVIAHGHSMSPLEWRRGRRRAVGGLKRFNKETSRVPMCHPNTKKISFRLYCYLWPSPVTYRNRSATCVIVIVFPFALCIAHKVMFIYGNSITNATSCFHDSGAIVTPCAQAPGHLTCNICTITSVICWSIGAIASWKLWKHSIQISELLTIALNDYKQARNNIFQVSMVYLLCAKDMTIVVYHYNCRLCSWTLSILRR